MSWEQGITQIIAMSYDTPNTRYTAKVRARDGKSWNQLTSSVVTANVDEIDRCAKVFATELINTNFVKSDTFLKFRRYARNDFVGLAGSAATLGVNGVRYLGTEGTALPLPGAQP